MGGSPAASTSASKSKQLGMDQAVRTGGIKPSRKSVQATGHRCSSQKNSKRRKGLLDRALEESWSPSANLIYTLQYKIILKSHCLQFAVLFNKIFFFSFSLNLMSSPQREHRLFRTWVSPSGKGPECASREGRNAAGCVQKRKSRENH